MALNWSSILPSHLLSSILGRLPVADQVRSAVVCTAWREAAAEIPRCHRTAEIPWLMIPVNVDREPDYDCYFFSIEEGKYYKFNLPQIYRKYCIGSSDGWIIAVGAVFLDRRADTEICLLDPITSNVVPLPHILFGSTIIKVAYSPSASAVVAMHYNAHENPVLSFARPGGSSWTELDLEDYHFFEDIIPHKGQFYMVSSMGLLASFDPNDPNDSTRLKPCGPVSSLGSYDNFYLESFDGDDLLLVGRIMDEESEMTESFRVFRQDPSSPRWVEVRSLGECAIFLGGNKPLCISTWYLPKLRRNCIYFTEDHSRLVNIGDMGVFNLEHGSIEKLDSLQHIVLDRGAPTPFWITPTLSSSR